jgi:hypothetical protein
MSVVVLFGLPQTTLEVARCRDSDLDGAIELEDVVELLFSRHTVTPKVRLTI